MSSKKTVEMGGRHLVKSKTEKWRTQPRTYVFDKLAIRSDAIPVSMIFKFTLID